MIFDVTNVFGSKNGLEKGRGKPVQFRRAEPRAELRAGWRKAYSSQGSSSSDEDGSSESGNSISSDSLRNNNNTIEMVTPENVIKHPLEHTWTLWYFKSDRNVSWEDSQKKVYDISTCEDFWGLYNHTKNASALNHGNDYSFFKEGIKPMWEDPANKNGGRWVINMKGCFKNKDMDTYWLEILLCLIGEAFEDSSDEVCGAVCNIRARGDKIALWTADSEAEAQIMDIGRKLKERLGLEPMRLEYSSHKETAARVRRVGAKVFTL